MLSPHAMRMVVPRPAEICVNRFTLLLSKAGKPSDSLLSPGVLAFGLPHTRQQAVAFVTWELTPCYPNSVSPVNCHHHLGLSRLAVRPMNFHTSTLSVKLCSPSLTRVSPHWHSPYHPLDCMCGGWHMSFPSLPQLYLV